MPQTIRCCGSGQTRLPLACSAKAGWHAVQPLLTTRVNAQQRAPGSRLRGSVRTCRSLVIRAHCADRCRSAPGHDRVDAEAHADQRPVLALAGLGGTRYLTVGLGADYVGLTYNDFSEWQSWSSLGDLTGDYETGFGLGKSTHLRSPARADSDRGGPPSGPRGVRHRGTTRPRRLVRTRRRGEACRAALRYLLLHREPGANDDDPTAGCRTVRSCSARWMRAASGAPSLKIK